MDWVRDVYGPSSSDLENLFGYGSGGANVLQMMENDERPTLSFLENFHQVQSWGKNDCPDLGSSKAGLVLLCLKLAGEKKPLHMEKVQSDQWLSRYNTEKANVERHPPPTGQEPNARGRRSLKTVPFDQDTFELITSFFHVHGSVARTISRADTPVVSRMRAMAGRGAKQYEAWIYNIRTSNAWKSDHAMTITYFPHNGLTFGIIFGCKAATEAEFIKRLTLAGPDALHPLLAPGILIEIERRRHVLLAKDAIAELETCIYHLNPRPDTTEVIDQTRMEQLHKEKRTKWLNMTYLRNCLISWTDQLGNMDQYLAEIDQSQFPHTKVPAPRPGARQEDTPRKCSRSSVYPTKVNDDDPFLESERIQNESSDSTPTQEATSSINTCPSISENYVERCGSIAKEPASFQLFETSFKIKTRVQALINEYDDLVRDCSMRIEGMSMATQWAQGETNMEIAKATSRDSRHMRSISLVTMVFLPGTFFAGMFSTTFFSWKDGDAQPQLSNYFWVYIVITITFTLLTVGAWYYLNVFRHRSKKANVEEKISPV